MLDEPSRKELEGAHCWEDGDRVPGRPATTAFRRRARLHQARWRAAHGHPIGTQPIRPRPGGPPARPVGSRLPLDYARRTGANFLSPAAHRAAAIRTATKEAHQTLDVQRLWADLLWSTGLACNLFGDLAADIDLADRVVHAWWPDVPGRVTEIRLLHSPGRLDPAFLGNLVTVDAAVDLDLGDGSRGVLGVLTPYHDRIKPEQPKPERLARYEAVAESSGTFAPGALDVVRGGDLLVLWLQHLLVLSMVQHPSVTWRWARLVVVHPAGNTDFVDACAFYRDLLADGSSFASTTLEALLDAEALPSATTMALRERYVAS